MLRNSLPVILKQPLFYTGLLLAAIPVAISLALGWSRIAGYHKVFISLAALYMIIYCVNQYFALPDRIRREKTDIVKNILQWIQPINILETSKEIRANVCIRKHFGKDECYVIVNGWHINMDKYNDKNIKIPINRGLTGTTWNSQAQRWLDYPEIFDPKRVDGLPAEEMEKVWPEMKWICSTPIVKNSRVLGILNLDGNLDLLNSDGIKSIYKKMVLATAIKMADELAKYIC